MNANHATLTRPKDRDMKVPRALQVIVKGTRFDAARAAASRGIPLIFLCERRIANGYETTANVPASYHTLLAQWFSEPPPDAPFPLGTLLYYAEVR